MFSTATSTPGPLKPSARALRRRLASRLRPAATQRRFTLHIGLHKTGTTTIQTMLRDNRRALAGHLHVLSRLDPAVRAVTRITHTTATEAGAQAARADLIAAARALGRSCRHLPHTILSHEDIPGCLPTRHREGGLYPASQTMLCAVVEGLAAEGLIVEVIVMLREMDDWTRSVQQQKHQGSSGFRKPEAFRKLHGLPDTWDDLVARLTVATAPAPLHVLSFEDERRAPRFGQTILRLCDVPDSVSEGLNWPAPRNVRNPATPGNAAAG